MVHLSNNGWGVFANTEYFKIVKDGKHYKVLNKPQYDKFKKELKAVGLGVYLKSNSFPTKTAAQDALKRLRPHARKAMIEICEWGLISL